MKETEKPEVPFPAGFSGPEDRTELGPKAAPSRPAKRPGDTRGFVVWFTGLSGAGKSTLAEATASQLRALGGKVEVLDGDAVRAELWPELRFSRADRDTNVARIARVARLLARNGVAVLVAAISPYREAREQARALIGDFVEVHVSTPLDVCMRRDVKGLYAKALAGVIPAFTGVSDPYEAPRCPEVCIDTSYTSTAEAAVRVVSAAFERGYVRAA